LAATVPRLDPDGVALLEQMLVYNPDKRISAVDAMRHPYFKSLPKAIHDLDDSMCD
jgi:serine/threonine protein kinase